MRKEKEVAPELKEMIQDYILTVLSAQGTTMPVPPVRNDSNEIPLDQQSVLALMRKLIRQSTLISVKSIRAEIPTELFFSVMVFVVFEIAIDVLRAQDRFDAATYSEHVKMITNSVLRLHDWSYEEYVETLETHEQQQEANYAVH